MGWCWRGIMKELLVEFRRLEREVRLMKSHFAYTTKNLDFLPCRWADGRFAIWGVLQSLALFFGPYWRMRYKQ